MSIYTLTTNLIENLQSSEKSIFGSLFQVLTNVESGNKLAIDINKRILILYAEANIAPELKRDYKYWLDYLTDRYIYDDVCEPILVDIDIRDKNKAFLDLASSVNGSRKIIVYCRNSNCPYECDEENAVEHNGKKIYVLDKKDAVREINSRVINNITTEGDNSPINFGNHNTVKIKN